MHSLDKDKGIFIKEFSSDSLPHLIFKWIIKSTEFIEFKEYQKRRWFGFMVYSTRDFPVWGETFNSLALIQSHEKSHVMIPFSRVTRIFLKFHYTSRWKLFKGLQLVIILTCILSKINSSKQMRFPNEPLPLKNSIHRTFIRKEWL